MKQIFLPVKKTEKKVKTGRQRKKLSVKKVKKVSKSGREKPKVPVKKSEKWLKRLSHKKNTSQEGRGPIEYSFHFIGVGNEYWTFFPYGEMAFFEP